MDSIWSHPPPPNDPSLVNDVVNHLKSQGIFDQFRYDCLADVDTKPSYQNLSQRVNVYTTKYLSTEEWNPDLNKNEFRNKLRRQIEQSGMLSSGVNHVVDQVVNPKIFQVFMPKIREIVKEQIKLKQQEEEASRLRKLKPDPDAEASACRSRIYGIFPKASDSGPSVSSAESCLPSFPSKVPKIETSSASKLDVKVIPDIKVRESPELQSTKQRNVNKERDKAVQHKTPQKIMNTVIKKEVDIEKDVKPVNITSSIKLPKPLEKKKEKPVEDVKPKVEPRSSSKEKASGYSSSVTKKSDSSKPNDTKSTALKQDSKHSIDLLSNKVDISKNIKVEKDDSSSDKLKEKKKEKCKEEQKSKYKSSSSSALKERSHSHDSSKSSSSAKGKTHDMSKPKISDSEKSESKHKSSHYHHESQSKHSTPDKSKSYHKEGGDTVSKSQSSSKSKSIQSSSDSSKQKTKVSSSLEVKSSKSKDGSTTDLSGSTKSSLTSKDSSGKKSQHSSHSDKYEKGTSNEKKTTDGRRESKSLQSSVLNSEKKQKSSSDRSKSYHSNSEKSKTKDSRLEKSHSHSEKNKPHGSHSEKSKGRDSDKSKSQNSSHNEKSKSHDCQMEKRKSHDTHSEKHKSQESHTERNKSNELHAERSKSVESHFVKNKSHEFHSERTKAQESFQDRSKPQESSSGTEKVRCRTNFEDLKFDKEKTKPSSSGKDGSLSKSSSEKLNKEQMKKTQMKVECSSSSQSSLYAATSSKSSFDGSSDAESHHPKADVVKKGNRSCKDEKKVSTPIKPPSPPPQDLLVLLQMQDLDESNQKAGCNQSLCPTEFDKPTESTASNYHDAESLGIETYDDLAMLCSSDSSSLEDSLSISDSEIKSLEDENNSAISPTLFPVEEAASLVQKAGIVITAPDKALLSETSSENSLDKLDVTKTDEQGSSNKNSDAEAVKPTISDSNKTHDIRKSLHLRSRKSVDVSEDSSQLSEKMSKVTHKRGRPRKNAQKEFKASSKNVSGKSDADKEKIRRKVSTKKNVDDSCVEDLDDSSHSNIAFTEKRECRRQRKLNPKYASNDYASIFNACKKNNESSSKISVNENNDTKDNDDDDDSEKSDESSESSSSSSSSASSSEEEEAEEEENEEDKEEEEEEEEKSSSESVVESQQSSSSRSQGSTRPTVKRKRIASTSSEDDGEDESENSVMSTRSTRSQTKRRKGESEGTVKTSDAQCKTNSENNCEVKKTGRNKANANSFKASKATSSESWEKPINNRRLSREASRSNDKNTVISKKDAKEDKRLKPVPAATQVAAERNRRKAKEPIVPDRSKSNGHCKNENHRSAQRYDSSDLYKPRPVIQSSTRRSRAHTPPL